MMDRSPTVSDPLSASASSLSSIPQTSFIHATELSAEDEAAHELDNHDDNNDEECNQELEVFEDEIMDEAKGKAKSSSPKISSSSSSNPPPPPSSSSSRVSAADVEIFQRLDSEYDRAIEEREVSYAARYKSVRQSACFAVIFMVLYMILGTVYFSKQAGWTLEESLFFGIYTITTVGYGNLDNPETPAFQIYTIFFILIGTATLTIMVAQLYQCLALEAGRAQHSRDKTEMMRRGLDISQKNNIIIQRVPLIDRFFRCFDVILSFLMTNEYGRALSVLFPLVTLIALGATVVGLLEGWTAVESIYFAVVSLTTVGFGDYFPTRTPSRLFCIIWLPFSVGFMSLYLGNIAAFYIRLSDRNIARIERQLRRKIDALKQRSQMEKEAVRQRALRGQGLVLSNFNALPTDEMTLETNAEQEPAEGLERPRSSSTIQNERRKRVIRNHLGQVKKTGDGSLVSSMSTMKDVIRAVHANLRSSPEGITAGPESEYLSFHSSRVMSASSLMRGQPSVRKPSFALRVLVQERFAEIIAREVAGYQSEIAIKDSTLTVTIDTLKSTTEKWLIPRKARRAFRAVAFEALFFVGEHGLITQGSDALYALNPFEYHGLFAPLLAALGDADTMEAWLRQTDILAEYDLYKGNDLNNNTGGDSPKGNDQRDVASIKTNNIVV